MKKFNATYLSLFFIIGLINIINAQVIYSTDFGTVQNVNPANWTFSGVDLTISNNTPSTGYPGVSGGCYLGEGNSVAFVNTFGTSLPSSQVGTSVATLTVNTTGFPSVILGFGMRKSSATYNANATYTLEWSPNGSTFFTIPYTESSAGNWGLASGAGLTLPAGAGNIPVLYIRWTFVRTGTASNFKIDDVSVTASVVTPGTISFLSNDSTAVESTGSAPIYMKLTTSSTASCSIDVTATAWSNASASDYTIAAATVTFAAGAPVNSTAPVLININNDAIIESSEYIILKMSTPVNANIGTINQMAFYIKDDDKVIPAPSNALTLNLLSSFSNTVAGSNSAEIVVHDPTTQRLYIANSIAAKLDIVNFINPSAPVLITSIPITPYGNINSVAVRNGIVACAIENTNPQDTGKIVFFDKDGNFLKQVKAGAMPDMITFNHAGTRVITANEGEPNMAYTNDPDGSVTVVDISGGIAALTQANVTQILFTAYNGQEATLRAQGIRIYGGASPTSSKDFEPEYVAVAPDDSKAWITLQENNAIVEINLATNTITAIRALGTKNHNLLNNGMDVSNMTKKINIGNFPVKGFYLPDAIYSYTVAGINYLVTANEGDTRAYSGFTEETRVKSVTLDPTKFPNQAELKNDYVLGRLTITDKNGDTDLDGDIDTIYSIGARSFSIWNGATGQLVYDSGDDLEQITASNSFSVMFNASNAGSAAPKDRSDDKGPEQEGVAIGTIGANTYAFIALERIGGVMVYDITNPNTPIYVTYVNNRSFATNGPDRGSEGVIFIPQSESPNGQHIVIAANETSSTLSIWGIPGCPAPLSSALSVAGGTLGCANTTTLSVPFGSGLSYQWSQNSSTITGATANTLAVNASGNYSVSITGGVNCATSSLSQSITVSPSPTVSISSATAVCIGQTATLTASGASTYSWNTTATTTNIAVSPTTTTTYSVIGTGTNSCVSTTSVSLVVNPNPTVSITPTLSTVCSGQSVALTAGGANTYSWSNGATTMSISPTPTASITYSVTGTDINNCFAINAVSITVNPNPTISIVPSASTICNGQSVALNVSGASTYSWNTSATTTSISVSPTTTTTYSVIGTDINNCSSTKNISITVGPSPTVTAISTSSLICVGQTATLTASGAFTYTWSTLSNAASIVISPSVTTTYTVNGSLINNCGNSAIITQSVSTCAGVVALQTSKNLRIYPNPANDNVTIISENSGTPIRVEVTNTLGEVIFAANDITENGNRIDVSKYAKGIYYVNTLSDGQRTNTILIVQ